MFVFAAASACPPPDQPESRKPERASGVSKAFYDNGFLKHRGRVKDGEMHGDWTFYRRDGSPLRSGRFVRGEQRGLWTTYDRAGNPHRVTDLG